MATYNGQKYIREQIDSILSQLGQEDELVISDDASTDSTLEIIRGYGDKRIKLYPFVRNKSAYKKSAQLVTTNFEHALQHAKGNVIFLSDQDDVWLPGKVEKCLEALRQADLVVHDCRVADAKLNIVRPSYFSLIHVQGGFIHNFIKVKYLGCCMAFRREVLTAALPMKKTIDASSANTTLAPRPMPRLAPMVFMDCGVVSAVMVGSAAGRAICWVGWLGCGAAAGCGAGDGAYWNCCVGAACGATVCVACA